MANEPPSDRDVTRHLQRVYRLVPEDQVVTGVPSRTPVSVALACMRTSAFSQVVVQENGRVLGLFSYRSFAEGVARYGGAREAAAQLPVEEFLEEPYYVRLQDSIEVAEQLIKAHDAVLVGDPTRVSAVLTADDLATYYGRVTRPYRLLEEIERSLRELVRGCASPGVLAEFAQEALKEKYKDPSRLPCAVENMDLGDVIEVVTRQTTWSSFESAFSSPRDRVLTRLHNVRKIRNAFLHFRLDADAPESDEYERALDDLREARDWLRVRIDRMSPCAGGETP